VAYDKMEVELLEQAKNDLHEMDNSIYLSFVKHLKKLADLPFQRHLKHNLPYYVEEVGQGRIIYSIESDIVMSRGVLQRIGTTRNGINHINKC
jgi:mRNA-degrading endonuclease RelE of RelBE toxin-antitoxin system